MTRKDVDARSTPSETIQLPNEGGDRDSATGLRILATAAAILCSLVGYPVAAAFGEPALGFAVGVVVALLALVLVDRFVP